MIHSQLGFSGSMPTALANVHPDIVVAMGNQTTSLPGRLCEPAPTTRQAQRRIPSRKPKALGSGLRHSDTERRDNSQAPDIGSAAPPSNCRRKSASSDIAPGID